MKYMRSGLVFLAVIHCVSVSVCTTHDRGHDGCSVNTVGQEQMYNATYKPAKQEEYLKTKEGDNSIQCGKPMLIFGQAEIVAALHHVNADCGNSSTSKVNFTQAKEVEKPQEHVEKLPEPIVHEEKTENNEDERKGADHCQEGTNVVHRKTNKKNAVVNNTDDSCGPTDEDVENVKDYEEECIDYVPKSTMNKKRVNSYVSCCRGDVYDPQYDRSEDLCTVSSLDRPKGSYHDYDYCPKQRFEKRKERKPIHIRKSSRQSEDAGVQKDDNWPDKTHAVEKNRAYSVVDKQNKDANHGYGGDSDFPGKDTTASYHGSNGRGEFLPKNGASDSGNPKQGSSQEGFMFKA